MEFVLDKALRGVLLPGAVAAVALAATCWRAPGPRPWPGALAVGPGFLAAFLAIKGFPGAVPAAVLGWLFHAALLGLALGLSEGALAARPRWRWSGRGLAVLLLVLATLRPKLGRWEAGGVAAALIGLPALGLLVWLALDRLRAALPAPREEDPDAGGAGAAGVQVALVGAGAAVLALGGSAVLGQLGGALAAAATPLLLAAWWRPGLPLLRGAGPALALLLGGLLLNAAFYTPDLSPAVPLLLVAAPWGAQLARLPQLRARPAWARLAVAGAGVLLLTLAAGGVAFVTSPPEDPYAGY